MKVSECCAYSFLGGLSATDCIEVTIAADANMGKPMGMLGNSEVMAMLNNSEVVEEAAW